MVSARAITVRSRYHLPVVAHSGSAVKSFPPNDARMGDAEMSAMAAASHPGGEPSYIIQGERVVLPVRVRDASSGAATFVVPARAARRFLPVEGLEVAEILPGRTLLSLAAIEYRDNDLGRYNEVSITFFVRETGAPRGIPYLGTMLDFGRGRIGTYIHRLPVDGSFTCEAGRTIWGFPKTVEKIDMEKTGDRATCKLTCGGTHVLTLSLPRGGTRALPESTMTTYSVIDGALHKTAFGSSGEQVGFRLGGAEVRLGNHPIADELRALGLPKRAVMTMWMERMRGTFWAAVPV
jgi:hypothetical protein